MVECPAVMARVQRCQSLHVHVLCPPLYWQVAVINSPSLVQVPSWLATNASIATPQPCPATSPVIISNTASYQAYLASPQASAITLGQVIISWPQITSAQLARVLQNKTAVSELVIENGGRLTTLSPAVDSIATVNTRLILENLDGLRGIAFPALTQVGLGVRVIGCQRIRSVSMPLLTSIGDVLVVLVSLLSFLLASLCMFRLDVVLELAG